MRDRTPAPIPIAEIDDLNRDVRYVEQRAAEDRIAMRALEERVTSLEKVVVHLDKTVGLAMRWFVGVSITCTASVVWAVLKLVATK